MICPTTAGVASSAMPSSWLTNCTFDHLTSTIAVWATHALRVRLSTMCSLPSPLLPRVADRHIAALPARIEAQRGRRDHARAIVGRRQDPRVRVVGEVGCQSVPRSGANAAPVWRMMRKRVGIT
jgi:hypothetical protein